MSLLQLVKSILRKSSEIRDSDYLSNYLKADDAKNLPPFVKTLGDSMKIPSAIIAVGSSTYPKKYWDNLREYNLADPKLGAAQSYHDIDLLVVPENITSRVSLENNVRNALSSHGYKFDFYKDSVAGVSYCSALSGNSNGTWFKCIAPYLNIDNGMHSITTNLTNGTKVDLIIGREDLLKVTATEKINFERNKGYPFSILYRRDNSLNN